MYEQTWVDLARKGDSWAFNQLVLCFQDRVYTQAFWMVGEADTAEDLAQEAFITAFYKLGSYKGGSFEIWLLRIIINLSLDELRRRNRRPSVALEPLNAAEEEIESPDWLVDPSSDTEGAFDRIEFEREVQSCIGQLPLEFRTAVILVDVQGLNYAEAASAMHVSIGTVKSRLGRGRMRLQKALAALDYSSGRAISLRNIGTRIKFVV